MAQIPGFDSQDEAVFGGEVKDGIYYGRWAAGGRHLRRLGPKVFEILSGSDFLGPAPSYVLIRDPYLFRYAEGRKSRARLSGGHFIKHLAIHFGLAWVAQGLKRQQDATAGTFAAAEGAAATDDGAQAISAPMQAPQPPPPAPQPRTMSHRIKEEMHELRQSVVGL
nr:hypothetical protein [Tanacetum cinerariifolium]